ncbi:MAG: hypothetical protein ACHQD9_09235, partial [Chitinophagales bacterium]
MTKKKTSKKTTAASQKPAEKAKAKPASSFSTLRLIWLAMLVLILFPLFKSLSGNQSKSAKNPHSFSWNGWFAGDYQKQTESFLKKSWVYGSQFIARKNQIDFDWFKKVNVNNFVMGKDDYIFSEIDMKTFNGSNYTGEDSMRNMLGKLKVVADSLKKKNIDVVIVIAPGKSYLFPDEMPEGFGLRGERTTGDAFRKVSSELNLNVVDFSSWFQQINKSSKYPLYSKYGLHWSYYGECLAADSLIHYLRQSTQKDFPYWGFGNIQVVDTCIHRDFDIVAKLNLKHPPKCYGMAYPQIRLDQQSPHNTTPVLSVSDSYYRGFSYLGVQDEIFDHGDYWYYFNKIYNQESNGTTEVWETDLKKSIERNKVVLLMSTESSLDNLGWGFIQQAYLLYTNPTA